MTERERPIGIDVFCGAGGMSLGFEQAGFDVVAAVDSDPIHIAIHLENFPNCKTLRADLSRLSGDELRLRASLDEEEIDVVFGGPPCGGYSMMGRRDPDDSRNGLLNHFARLVMELDPRYFVVENVEGLLIDPMTKHVQAFKSRLKSRYLIIEPVQVLNAYDFGVPQRRRRIFIFGYRKGLLAPEYPTSPLDGNGASRRPTVWDAIGDLPDIDDSEGLLDGDVYEGELPPAESRYAEILRGEVEDPDDFSHTREHSNGKLTGCGRIDHTPEVVRRFEATKPGTRECISKFYRLMKDGIAPTLRAGTDASRGSYSAARPIHPVKPRCITVREGARLHSFPDWFELHSTKWHGFRQVGNSVPPLLARAVARSVYYALNRTTDSHPG